MCPWTSDIFFPVQYHPNWCSRLAMASLQNALEDQRGSLCRGPAWGSRAPHTPISNTQSSFLYRGSPGALSDLVSPGRRGGHMLMLVLEIVPLCACTTGAGQDQRRTEVAEGLGKVERLFSSKVHGVASWTETCWRWLSQRPVVRSGAALLEQLRSSAFLSIKGNAGTR